MLTMFSVPFVFSHVFVSSAGHDGRRSGGKPPLFAAERRNRLLPFQLTAASKGKGELDYFLNTCKLRDRQVITGEE